ncbi:hypothetical protein C3L33_19141, partial [Rhododendron williamsianum]
MEHLHWFLPFTISLNNVSDSLKSHCTDQKQFSLSTIKGMCILSESIYLQLLIILEPFLWKKSNMEKVSDSDESHLSSYFGSQYWNACSNMLDIGFGLDK